MICKLTELKCISQYRNGKGVAVRYSSDEESRDKMSSSGERHFQIKWRGTTRKDLVASYHANIKCPQMVIDKLQEDNTVYFIIS